MMTKEKLLLELGTLPEGATKKIYDRQMVRVTPKNVAQGEPCPVCGMKLDHDGQDSFDNVLIRCPASGCSYNRITQVKPYDTYLLRQAWDVDGNLLVSHVSGPTAIFPDENDIEMIGG